jgi:hypothetical protein
MLKLKLIRTNLKDSYTVGRLFISDIDEFLAYTLEDTVRDLNADGDLNDYNEQKIYGKTAIPYGKYEGRLRYSPSKDRMVPEIIGVKHFSNIQMHSGNRVSDTLGCILVAKKQHGDTLWDSYEAERELIRLIEKHGGKFEIEIL